MNFNASRPARFSALLVALCATFAFALPAAGAAPKSAADKPVPDPPAPKIIKEWADMTKCASCAAANDPSPKEKKECAAACKRAGMD